MKYTPKSILKAEAYDNVNHLKRDYHSALRRDSLSYAGVLAGAVLFAYLGKRHNLNFSENLFFSQLGAFAGSVTGEGFYQGVKALCQKFSFHNKRKNLEGDVLEIYKKLLRIKGPLEIHYLQKTLGGDYPYILLDGGEELLGNSYRNALGINVLSGEWGKVHNALIELEQENKS